MAKLTQKQKRQLERILSDLERAEGYIRGPEITGIARIADSPNGASYILNSPACLAMNKGVKAIDVMHKETGSDIVGLYSAREALDAFLKDEGGN